MRNVREWDPRRSARALSFWIAIVVILVLTAMWAGVLISVNQSQDAALKAIKSDAANLAFAFDEDVTHTLDNIDGTMQAVANRMAARWPDVNIYALSRQFPIITPPTVHAAVISAKGKIISGTWAAKLPPETSAATEDFFRIHRDGKFKGMFIGRPVKDPAHDDILIPISERVESPEGRFIAVLVFYVSPAKLTTLYQSINVGRNGAIALAGTDGVILARYSKATPDWVEKNTADAPPARIGPKAVPENSEGSFIQQSPVDKITRVYAYRRGWDYPAIVAVGLDYQEGLALARSHARMLYTLAIGATLLLGGFALYLVREIRTGARRDAQLAAERTKLQVANAELIESKERAEVANHAKSLFLANMSHELRTPLNAIIGFSQVIKDQVMGPVGKMVYAEYANDIYRAGEHLLEIICNLLDISKIEAGKTELKEEMLDPADLVADSIAAVRVQADKKNIALHTDIPKNRPMIRGDAVRLRQVLINLLSNAVKFTESGHVAVSLVSDNNHSASLVVTDTGIGMSPDEIQVALEPFGQVENAITKKYEGAGLGLPLAKRLVELHGGELIIMSAKGAGTAIRVQLPADRVAWPVRVAAE
jgi:signal transduction histidine kinase